MTRPTQTLTTTFGHTVVAFRNDHVGDKIAKYGLYEKENLELLLTLLKKIHSPVVLDIGANIGNHSLAFATAASRVLAFEPLPAVYALLAENIRANHLDNITAYPFALSDTEEDATIYMVREGNVGASSFDRREDNVEAVTVRKRIGDDVIRESDIKKIDLVKIDVEAHEVFVLRGLSETLLRHKPIITMEWNDPLTIERLNGSEELRFLFNEYAIYVLGSNYDRGYWQDHPFAFLRRKLTRLLRPRRAALYTFHPARLYKNLLLIPKSKQAILDDIL